MAKVKLSHQLTLRDRLSQLSFEQACKLLGPKGRRAIIHGSRRDDIRIRDHVYFGGDLLRVAMPSIAGDSAITTLTLSADRRNRLAWNCDRCHGVCDHVGAMFALVLENKVALGLAAPPPEPDDALQLSDEELVARALEERQERSRTEKMRIKSMDPGKPWVDYLVSSPLSGKTYRVALRGLNPGDSYCSCPDFRVNTLGTCKHIMRVESYAHRKFSAQQLGRPYRPRRVAVHLRYEREMTLRLMAPANLPPEEMKIIAPLLGKPIDDILGLLRRLARLEAAGREYHIFPDAEEYIQRHLHAHRFRQLVDEIRRDPANHPLRKSLLKVEPLPYQLDGIAFAAAGGRTVLADDMGLGKTIQAVGAAELLAREADVRKVLVVCPASLKSQWRNEIRRFCNRDVQLIAGRMAERAQQYGNDCFFTVCNYEQVLRDITSIESCRWDLIILDEGQRIKNWEAKTTRVIKGLKSQFALVLSGTPLENRLDELYSIVQFIDDRRLGPGFRFFNEHRLLDEEGKVAGYKNLDALRQRLRPVLLRRTRESVRLELPERTTEIVRIPPSDEQAALHDAHMQIVATIVSKAYISEMDLLRLRTALLMCRMAADGTYLVNKELPNYSTKLERLADLFDDLADETDRKVVLFSEWTTMLDLIEPLLKQRHLGFVRLDGSVPQKRRQELVHQFQHDPKCRFFITTNAGSTGLNLQAANTVINVDLPWNPAILEQRIGRAHRMGQQRGVQVFVLITEGTIEENLLETLSSKKELALAALDPEAEVDVVEMRGGRDELKARLEILLGAKPAAPEDQSLEQLAESSVDVEHRQRVAEAGGQLLGAVFQFLGELVATGPAAPPPAPEHVVNDLRSRLDACVESDDQGRPRLSVTLPNRETLDTFAQNLARLLVAGQGDAEK